MPATESGPPLPDSPGHTPGSGPAWEATTHPRPSRRTYESVLDSLGKHIAVLDSKGTIVATNAAWRRFSQENGGVEHKTGVGSNYLAVCDATADSSGAEAAAGLRAVLSGELGEFSLDYRCDAPDLKRWFTLRATRFEEDGAARLVLQHGSITERRAAEDQAHLRSRLLDEVAAAVIGTDNSFRIIEWNRGAEALYGWTREQSLGRPIMDLVLPAESFEIATDAFRNLKPGEDWTGDMALRRRDGSVFPGHVRNATVLAADGAVDGYVGVSIDLTQRLQAEQDARSAQQYLAAITDSMAEGLLALDEAGRLVYLNRAAEELLGWTLEQLAGTELHPVARDSGESNTPQLMAADPIEQTRVAGAMVRSDDHHFIRADGSSMPVELTAAPFETPGGVRGSVVVFSDATERRAEQYRLERELESLTWVARIHEALTLDRFRLHAQPIVDLATGDVVQHELLIRMLGDDGTLIAPAAFLPAAEQHGVIGEIDRWVVTQAVALIAQGGRVEINLSAESIGAPGMADFVEERLTSAGANPERLVIELTETAILRDAALGRAFLERVEALGCKIALDDFGTGYGGFTYLKQLPVDYLKIDIEFIQDLARDKFSQQVVQAVVQLAAGLGKQTVAEGVEDADSLALVREYGVDFAQGYGIGRPKPIEESFPGFTPPDTGASP